MRNNGHTVLITGGASGIGWALADEFIRRGNKVIIIGKDAGRLERAKERQPGLFCYRCDLRSEADVASLVKRLNDEHPNLNILVNNAGIQHMYSFAEAGTADIHAKVAEEIAVNLTIPIQLTASLLPLLARQEQAAVINVSSGLGLAPKRSAPVYCATKAGLHLYSKALRYQLEGTSIRVFEIIPPIVDTDMTRGRGRGKISAEQLASEFWSSFVRDRLEIPIGKVKLLKMLMRLSPSFAERLLKNN